MYSPEQALKLFTHCCNLFADSLLFSEGELTQTLHVSLHGLTQFIWKREEEEGFRVSDSRLT